MKTPMNARRSFLVAGIAVPVVSAAPVVASTDDAELIALADRVVAAHRAYVQSYEPPAKSSAEERAREPEQTRLWDIAEELAEQLVPMVPTTFAGFVAKARVAYEMADKTSDGGLYIRGGVSDEVTGSLLANLTGRPFVAME